MQIQFLFTNVQIDERTKDYIQKRIERLEKILDKVLKTDVELEMDKKGFFRAEIMIETPNDLYRAEEITKSIEGSIDIAVDELWQQIERDKEKRQDMTKRGARSLKKKMTIDEKARF